MIVLESPGNAYRDPRTMFALLLLTQGVTLGGDYRSLVGQAWNEILATPPFGDVVALDPSKAALVAYSDNVRDDLGLRQIGTSLSVDPAKSGAIRDYLAAEKVRLALPPSVFPDPGPPSFREIDAIEVWPAQGRWGRVGSLVAIIVKGDQPGELYQLTSTPAYPVPFVAVVAAGDVWDKPIVRALGQIMATLSDEFELPGPDFRTAPATLVDPRPNVIVITNSQRAALVAGTPPHIALAGFPPVTIPSGWGAPSMSLKFHPHQGDAPSTSIGGGRAGAGGLLVEGAAGYRFNALRCDFDCLMRRMPNSSLLPIQDKTATFCPACESAIREQINNWRSTHLGRRPRILLDSQRPLCDTVRWKKAIPREGSDAFNFEAGMQPGWHAVVKPDSERGLLLRNVQLVRRGDPFALAAVIFTRIGFRDLKVKFAGEPEVPLSFDTALQNTATPPELRELRDATSPGFLGALRHRLTWDIPGHYSIEAVMSVVFKDSAADFDPGGAAIGNKIYPQLAMRFLKGKVEKGKLAKVESLSGSIELVCGNVLDPSLSVHPDLQHMLSGKQQVTFATDSNSSDWDSKYAWDAEDCLTWAGRNFTSQDIPQWGTWGADWKSGRLLADVIDPATTIIPAVTAAGFAGATARAGHDRANMPGLPHWSWLFDYLAPEVTGQRRFVGAYRAGERTPGGHDGGHTRAATLSWPTASDQAAPGLHTNRYEMSILKHARQGGFDSVHVHPAMGVQHGRTIVPAPFCADLCIHLHVRWGEVALCGQIPRAPGTINRPLYLGWGATGRLDQGAHTTLGAPLVPPNQHVEIAVDAKATDSTVTYQATAFNPAYRAFQVFLEQGTGVLWSFGGLELKEVALLAGGVRAINPTEIGDKLAEMTTLASSDPARLDRDLRHLFHLIYDRIRWYPRDHHRLLRDVQQVPDQSGATTGLEGL